MIRQAAGLAGSVGPEGQHADNHGIMLIRQAAGLAGSAGPEGQHADNPIRKAPAFLPKSGRFNMN